jgi:hypothetical protein
VPDPTGTEVQAEDESQAAEDAAEQLPAGIDAAMLRRYFTLNDADFGQIGQCRGASNKLGSPTLAWGRGRRSMVRWCSPSINQSYKLWPSRVMTAAMWRART